MKEYQIAINNLKNAFIKLDIISTTSNGIDFNEISNNEIYPFDKDFSEITSQVIDWCNDFNDKEKNISKDETNRIYSMLNVVNNNDSLAIYCGVEELPKYVTLGRTKAERKQILMMCYVANVTIIELINWTIEHLIDYIKDTDEYYDENAKYYYECFRLISELE